MDSSGAGRSKAKQNAQKTTDKFVRDNLPDWIKRWYKSKTVWFNIAVPTLAGVQDQFHLIQGFLSHNLASVTLFVVSIGNVFLRALTTTPLSAPGTNKTVKEVTRQVADKVRSGTKGA